MAQLSYWERRQVENMYKYMQDAEKTADEISKLYLKASRYISISADEIFEKYQTKHRLSENDAMRLVNSIQDKTSLDELLAKLHSTDDDKHTMELITQLEAPAYQARIEKLKQLQNQLDYVMVNVYQQEKAISTSHYVDLANEAYYRGIYDIQQQAGTSFSFGYVDTKMIDQVINSKWSGKNYSSRIWKNTKALAQDMKEELLINLVTGRTNREVAEIISNKYAVGSATARRLVRTESNYMATELNFRAYDEAGIEEYKYLATLDLRTSEICRELDGQIFKVKDHVIGVNCPPMHPWCRSTTVAAITKELANKGVRTAIEPATGKRIDVPASMTYDEWYKKYVTGNPDAELAERKVKNYCSDRTQWSRYRKVLGDNVPDSLDKFQDMKYNEVEKWRYTKLAYERQNKLINHPELKLPNVEDLTIANEKFTKYLLGGENQKGLAKGEAFTSRLGYSIDNWQELQAEIHRGASKYPVTDKGTSEYGTKYDQKMILYGKKGNPANVIVGWLAKPNGSVSMTSAYIKEVK